MIWDLELMVQHINNHKKLRNGRWVIARPVDYRYRSIKERLVDAWCVFTGKADAVKWPENQ